jgi:site-specific recombinase XerC
MKQSAGFPVLLQLFFTKRLMAQRQASPHTIASYRDTFRLLLQFAEKEPGKRPSEATFEDLSPTFIVGIAGRSNTIAVMACEAATCE